MPVTAQQGGAQGAGQGLDPRVAEPYGRSSPPILGDGGPRDPLKDWTRKDTALADTFSLATRGALTARALGLQIVEIVPGGVGSPGRWGR